MKHTAIIRQTIFLEEYSDEYLVLLPMADDTMAFIKEDDPPKHRPIIEAVYANPRHIGIDPDTFEYDFMGVRVK